MRVGTVTSIVFAASIAVHMLLPWFPTAFPSSQSHIASVSSPVYKHREGMPLVARMQCAT